MAWRGLLGWLLVVIAGGATRAQPYWLEVDLDGVPGNGPDTVAATVGESLFVDLWVMGHTQGEEWQGLLLVYATLCNEDGWLQFVEWTLGPVAYPCMQYYTETVSGGACTGMMGTGYVIGCATPAPFLFSRVTYDLIGGETFADLEVDLGNSYWIDYAYDAGDFVAGINGVIRIDATATEGMTWGRVKRLFR
ncbi:MAG: hypothetical protein FJY73_12760 [Candidatus Eisenbacteria bacterium]|nr:hypothetical protein [Candidatus Eisenbacteria bacterium]